MQKESIFYTSSNIFPTKKQCVSTVQQISHTALSTKSLPIPGLVCYTRFALLHFKDLKLNRSERVVGETARWSAMLEISK